MAAKLPIAVGWMGAAGSGGSSPSRQAAGEGLRPLAMPLRLPGRERAGVMPERSPMLPTRGRHAAGQVISRSP
jgi:hypothetical protein